ncbi:hypothetical protein VTH06DRAFT_1288 [Thermothelomyces fergusii]
MQRPQAKQPQPEVVTKAENLAEQDESQNSETEDEEMEDVDSEGSMTTENKEDGRPATGQASTKKSLHASQSAREESAGTPLSASSPWPCQPSRRMIQQLAQCTGLDNWVGQGTLPGRTARDVIVTALASVSFLEALGQSPVNPDDIGIDSDGRLFQVRNSSDEHDNYRADFFNMVKARRNRQGLEFVIDAMQAYSSAMDDCWLNKYGTYHLTNELETLVADVLAKKDFDISVLKRVLTESEKVVAKLEKTLSMFVAVKQDLLETGSTSVARWNQLREAKWFGKYKSHLLEVKTKEDMDRLCHELSQICLSYYGPLGHAQELMSELDYAVNVLVD